MFCSYNLATHTHTHSHTHTHTHSFALWSWFHILLLACTLTHTHTHACTHVQTCTHTHTHTPTHTYTNLLKYTSTHSKPNSHSLPSALWTSGSVTSHMNACRGEPAALWYNICFHVGSGVSVKISGGKLCPCTEAEGQRNLQWLLWRNVSLITQKSQSEMKALRKNIFEQKKEISGHRRQVRPINQTSCTSLPTKADLCCCHFGRQLTHNLCCYSKCQ